jgi:hypothetical protein
MGLVIVPTLYDDESSISAWIKEKFPLGPKKVSGTLQSQSKLVCERLKVPDSLLGPSGPAFRAALTLGPQAATVEYRGKTLGGRLSFA